MNDQQLARLVHAYHRGMWNSGADGAIYVPIASEDWYALAQEEGGVVTGTEPVASNYQGNIVDPPTWEETFTTNSDGG